MADVRRIIMIFVIAVLFTILINVSIEAFYPSPDYQDYCTKSAYSEPARVDQDNSCPTFKAPQPIIDSCTADKGYIAYEYNESGCAVKAYCETCGIKYDEANKLYNLVVFIVSAITGLIALFVGLYLPQKKNPINEWIGSGFLLGGLLTIFVGTIRYFGEMGRYTRPVVIFIELALVIYLAYKKLGKKK